MKTILITLMTLFAMTANAGFINLIDEIEKPSGLGESAWSTLSLVDDEGFTATFTAGNAFVYADWGNAGLGVCDKPLDYDFGVSGSTANQCDPSSDDGLDAGETLFLSYDTDVLITLYLNANHDGGLNAGSSVLVNGAATSISDGATDSYFLAMGDTLSLTGTRTGSHYLEAIETEQSDDPNSVPEPASALLLGLGMFGLGAMRRKRIVK